MATITVFCGLCGRGLTQTLPILGEWPDCGVCGPTTWHSADQPDDRRFPYELHHNDRKLLRSLGIEAD